MADIDDTNKKEHTYYLQQQWYSGFPKYQLPRRPTCCSVFTCRYRNHPLTLVERYFHWLYKIVFYRIDKFFLSLHYNNIDWSSRVGSTIKFEKYLSWFLVDFFIFFIQNDQNDVMSNQVASSLLKVRRRLQTTSNN